MAKQIHTLSINFTGGIISPGHLHEVLQIAAAAKVTQVRFGQRQQLLIDVPARQLKQFTQQCREQDILFHEQGACPNITSSYPAAGIFTGDSWLTEGVYKDVFDLFDYTPALKLNICDSTQTFVPFFTGHINWIASEHAHYWYLFVRFPGTGRLLPWPELVYTNHISRVSRHIESLLGKGADGSYNLYEQTKKDIEYMGRPADQELELPPFHLPYYEGFNRHNNGYWLGIYRRDERFPLAFLQDICAICMETRTGQLYATPWKTIIIKNIDPAHRHLWDYTLGKYRINVRHAANELNWHVEDNSEDALVVKRHIVRHFDIADLRTYGLCFSVRIQAAEGQFGSVVIRRQENKYGSKLKYMQRYDILYTPGFNPNTSALLLYRENVPKEQLGPYLAALCKHFYELGSEANALQDFVSSRQALAPVMQAEKSLHQCRHCLSVYDETLGEPELEIAPGTAFAALPAHFCCQLCGAPATDFEEVSESVLGC
ncbi:rubredoxin [Chitinophaga japonensis]|uniref:Rubredoxin n=1 Tax=Chitinophaga japonensis TaxID=104662 RepID=A0A562SSU1_CHIJA|nr:rubredoxin [Chitinophaga japonensis]TWI84084.1 rubredoxin [Chitinophaga japonensis]